MRLVRGGACPPHLSWRTELAGRHGRPCAAGVELWPNRVSSWPSLTYYTRRIPVSFPSSARPNGIATEDQRHTNTIAAKGTPLHLCPASFFVCNSNEAIQHGCLCEVEDDYRLPALESTRGGSRSDLYARRSGRTHLRKRSDPGRCACRTIRRNGRRPGRCRRRDVAQPCGITPWIDGRVAPGRGGDPDQPGVHRERGWLPAPGPPPNGSP
jgi:hypothetical protein